MAARSLLQKRVPDGAIRALALALAGLAFRSVGVITLIREHDLDAHRDAILAAVRPGYRLLPDADGPHRIGGSPDLASGARWPVDADGVSFTFVAQFDCSQLPLVAAKLRRLALARRRFQWSDALVAAAVTTAK
jgi:hypothetical protein